MTASVLRAALAVLALAGCRSNDPTELIVFAASSLGDVAYEVAREFEAAHPGVTVTLRTAGSQELRAQLEHGAHAHVVALADAAPLEALFAAGLTGAPLPLAENELVIATPPDDARITDLAGLATVERLALAATEVPAGRHAEALLLRAETVHGAGFRARVLARVVTRDLNVRQVLSRIRLGEVDAGIVYASDTIDAPVRTVRVPPELAERVVSAVAIVRDAPPLAAELLSALRGAHEVLRRRGMHPAAP